MHNLPPPADKAPIQILRCTVIIPTLDSSSEMKIQGKAYSLQERAAINQSINECVIHTAVQVYMHALRTSAQCFTTIKHRHILLGRLLGGLTEGGGVFSLRYAASCHDSSLVVVPFVLLFVPEGRWWVKRREQGWTNCQSWIRPPSTAPPLTPPPPPRPARRSC